MKVNELLEEDWKRASALVGVPVAIAMATAAIAPKAEINGKTYDKAPITAVERGENIKTGVATINGKRVKVIYGISSSSNMKYGGRPIYAVKDDE